MLPQHRQHRRSSVTLPCWGRWHGHSGQPLKDGHPFCTLSNPSALPPCPLLAQRARQEQPGGSRASFLCPDGGCRMEDPLSKRQPLEASGLFYPSSQAASRGVSGNAQKISVPGAPGAEQSCKGQERTQSFSCHTRGGSAWEQPLAHPKSNPQGTAEERRPPGQPHLHSPVLLRQSSADHEDTCVGWKRL